MYDVFSRSFTSLFVIDVNYLFMLISEVYVYIRSIRSLGRKGLKKRRENSFIGKIGI